MKLISFYHCLLIPVLSIWCVSQFPVKCNPLGFDMMPSYFGSAPYSQQMIMAPQFDPYSMMATNPYMYAAPPFMPLPFDSSRRSIAGLSEPSNKSKHSKKLTDEQKALGDVPVSFLDNDEPSTFSERLSDSISAIGEGVRNHFRSISENFSDTVDDIKDAWKSSESSSKRG